jgi:hypothetical protein
VPDYRSEQAANTRLFMAKFRQETAGLRAAKIFIWPKMPI